MKRFPVFLLGFLLMVGSARTADDQWVYFGTYTKGDSKGIYAASFDSESGSVGELRLVAELENPSFLAIHPDGGKLYAVSEVANFEGGGSVNAYSISRDTGDLTFLNRQPTGGGAPCHLSLDSKGKCLLVANYSGGNVVSYQIGKDGKISPPVSMVQHEGSSLNEKRQKEPHAHSINPRGDDRFAYAADLGADRIFVYELNPDKGTIQSASSAAASPGSGPRHTAIDEKGHYLYAVNELDLTVSRYEIDGASGALKLLDSVSTLPEGVERVGSTAEIRIHPNGKFLYASNRGHNSIAVYRIDPETGALDQIQVEPTRSEIPRNFNFDRTGKYLFAAGQKSDSVSIFTIDSETGKLTFSDHQIPIAIPVCVRFLKMENTGN